MEGGEFIFEIIISIIIIIVFGERMEGTDETGREVKKYNHIT